MDKNDLNDNSLIDKTTLFFSSFKNSLLKNLKEEKITNEDHSSHANVTIFFEDLKNRYFSNSLENDMKGQEEQSLIVQNLSESEKTNFLNNIIQSSSENIDTMKMSISKTLDSSIEKFSDIKDMSIVLSQNAGNTVIDFSKNINLKFTELKLKQKLLNNMIRVDLIFIIAALYTFKSKYRKSSKEFIALTALVGLLNLLNNSKNNPENALKILDNSEFLLDDFFNEITFKSVVETTEPFIILIPNGNYILLILKLFI
ncbi:hypothetical protein QO200_09320 [Flavobacterium sp. Arc3]|uniref:hypothetical protein n=1 Tax=Flavobacterium sp. Arc3 TaxID=3046686 RepID=UPI00352CBA9D